MFNFFNYCLDSRTLGAQTLESRCTDKQFHLSVLDQVEKEIVKKNPFLDFLNMRGYLDVCIKDNAIKFSTNPLCYVLACKKYPDYEFKITKERE